MTDRIKWEYLVLTMSPGNDKHIQTQLNQYGSTGWEVVAVSVQFTSHFVWMKRPAAVSHS